MANLYAAAAPGMLTNTSSIAIWSAITGECSCLSSNFRNTRKTMRRYRRIGSTPVGTITKDWSARQWVLLPNVSATTPTKITISSMVLMAGSNARAQDANASISTISPYRARRISSAAVSTRTSSTRRLRKIVKDVRVKHSHLLGHAPAGTNLATIRRSTTKNKRRRRRERL